MSGNAVGFEYCQKISEKKSSITLIDYMPEWADVLNASHRAEFVFVSLTGQNVFLFLFLHTGSAIICQSNGRIICIPYNYMQ